MSNFQTVFAFIAVVSMILGVIFIFIDGMLLHAIAFFVIGMMIILIKVMWGISVWVDDTARRMSGND